MINRETKNRLEDQRGVAAVLVMGMTVVSLLFIAATASIAMSSQGSARHESQAAQASTAVDAGLQAALFWLNQVHPTAPTTCAGPKAGGYIGLVNADAATGWCPVASEKLDNGSTWEVRISKAIGTAGTCQSSAVRKIVAYGHSSTGDTTRKVAVTVSNGTGQSRFLTCGVQTTGPILMQGSSVIDGDAASNSTISLYSSAKICGNASVPNLTTDIYQQPGANTVICGSTGNVTGLHLTDDTTPLMAETQNTTGPHSISNLISTNGVCTNNIDWNATDRTLTLSGGGCPAELTLTGSTYRFCRLIIKDKAVLHTFNTNGMRIFMDGSGSIGTDTPCPSNLRTTQARLQISGTGMIDNQTHDPSDLWLEGETGRMSNGNPFQFQFGNANTSVNANMYLAVWAPSYQVDVSNQSKIVGGVAAEKVTMNGYGLIRWVDAVNGPVGTSNFGFDDTWVSCPGADPWGSSDPSNVYALCG